MTPEKISVVARRSRFEPTTRDSVAVNLISPTVVQGLMQILFVQGQQLAELNHKVDALATRPPQEVTIGLRQPEANTPVKTESPTDTTALAKTLTPQINRLRLRDIFD